MVQRTSSLALALASVVSLAACGEPSDAEVRKVMISSYESGNHVAATLAAKRLLQKDAQAGDARFYLGASLFRTGDVNGALQELERARDARVDPNLVYPTLAEARLAAGMGNKAVQLRDGAPPLQPKAEAAFRAQVALAEFQLGMAERSKADVDTALKADPKNAEARLVRALQLAGDKQLNEALALTEAVIADAPKNATAWTFKGELLARKADATGAVQAYRQALAIDPKRLPAHIGVLNVFRGAGDVAGFRAQMKDLKTALPGAPQTLYFDAVLGLLEGDLPRAREGSQQLLRLMPDDAMALALAGTVEVEMGQQVQGRAHLQRAAQITPDEVPPRRMLAVSWLRSGQPAEALLALKPLLEQPQPPTEVLIAAANAHLQSGDAAAAQSYYRKAMAVSPTDPEARVALAMMQIDRGDVEAGLAELNAVAQSEKGTSAELALLTHHLTRNDLDASLKVVDRIQAKKSNDPLPYLLRGRIEKLQKKPDAARTTFGKALELQPGYFPATLELAQMDVAQGKPEQAIQRYEEALKRDPKNAGAMLALAELQQKAGAKAEVVESLLQGAVTANPLNANTRLVFINYRLSRRQSKEAVTAAQDAVQVLPGDARLIEALGRAQLAAGDSQQALRTFRRALEEPSAPADLLLRMASYYTSSNDASAANEALQRALKVSPGNIDVTRAMIEMAISRKQYAEALRIARDLQKQRPREPVGFLMEAGVLAEQKSWDGALTAARMALDKERSAAVAIRLHALYLSAGRKAEADKFGGTWVREHPSDADFLFHLGSMALERKDFADAEAQYRGALALSPDNPLVLNNIAWAMVAQNKAGAVELARRSVQLAPAEPSFSDTLSRAYQADKKLPEAVAAARQAADSNMARPEHRLQLARVLIESGDRVAAKVELNRLAELGGRFREQAEVRRLQAGL